MLNKAFGAVIRQVYSEFSFLLVEKYWVRWFWI